MFTLVKFSLKKIQTKIRHEMIEGLHNLHSQKSFGMFSDSPPPSFFPGYKGSSGMSGFEGKRGDVGEKGLTGLTGESGLFGQVGPKGMTGQKGVKGEADPS